ncbi:MAG: ATP-binding protein [Candidatus Enteromonas sp.]|nr:ATP-binding protein [Candidatus Enteromonas sp.]
MDKIKIKNPVSASGGVLDSAQKEMLELLRKDERLCRLIRDEFHLSVAETKAALVPLLDLYEDLHYCDACPGYEACDKAIPHYQMELIREDGLFDRRLHLCPLARSVETYQSYFLYHDFPLSWNGCSLKASVERSQKKREALQKFTSVLAGKSKQWLYVYGNRGSGRTFLLACFALDFARNANEEKSVAFCDTTSLLDKLRDHSFQNKEKFAQEMEELISVPLLILDDFGSETKDKSGYAYSSILFPILNARAKENRLTGFSSDFRISEIAEMYAPSIGTPRARQLKDLLLTTSKSEIDISGLVFARK